MEPAVGEGVRGHVEHTHDPCPLPEDDLATYRSRVAQVTAADVERVARDHMPDPDRVAIVVVGKASEIRDPLTARFGNFDTIAPDACEKLSVAR